MEIKKNNLFLFNENKKIKEKLEKLKNNINNENKEIFYTNEIQDLQEEISEVLYFLLKNQQIS